jgi:hypothetical protein
MPAMEEEILGYQDSGAERLVRGWGCRHGLIGKYD